MKEEFYINISAITDPDNLEVLVNKHYYLSPDYWPQDLETIDLLFNPEGLLLRHRARVAFEQMCQEAQAQGLYLKAASTFRSYYYQWKVYLGKLTPSMSMEEYCIERDHVSARPGYSEHQTGLAVDINEFEESFADTREGVWLAKNSYHYGFILRYPKGKETITGYAYEPWHFRYLGRSTAEKVYQSGLTYDEFCALR